MESPSVAKAEFVLAKRFSLAKHPEYDEKWVECLLKENPSILGISSGVQFVSSQIRNSNGGKLDVLLKDDDEERVYSVELMLGQLDETHIIRCLDYWLRNKTRHIYREYEHVAVLVAESVLSSRFAEVVKLLSSSVNLIVMELAALQVQGYVTLHCTKIFDGVTPVEADIEVEPVGPAVTWPPDTLALVNNVLDLARPAVNDTIAPNPRQDGIGVKVGNRVQNFLFFRPKQTFVRVAAFVSDPEQWGSKLQLAGITVLSSQSESRVRFRLTPEILDKNRDLIGVLCIESAKSWLNA